uniref:Chaperone protein DnaJ n=1 Tax=Noccaea caerulescens TaxID=107243 RepID=A0A1J3HFU7_NOCCA
MQVEEAKILLGFPPNSRPDPSQVKAAYRKKVWESHPDLFPDDQKLRAESKFKSISQAYTCLESGDVKGQRYSRAGVVKTGVPRTYASAKRGNAWLIGAPFLFIVLGTIGLGGVKANRAYNMQKQTFPSHNPFLP